MLFSPPHFKTPFYINLSGFNIHNIQHASGNRPLKGPALGLADEYTILLLLVCSIKPVFYLHIFSYEATFC